MSLTARHLGIAALVMVVMTTGPLGASDDDPDQLCLTCHDTFEATRLHTAHGLDRPNAPTCESCHGDGSAHMEEGDASLISVPRGVESNDTCTTCHAGIHTVMNSGDVHSTRGVACVDCHQAHPETPAAAAMLSADPDELCATCHARTERTFNRPFGHRLGQAGVSCISCHDPHGGLGERSLKKDRAGDTACVSCHAEKRGPFVFPHVTDVSGGDCMSCHEPHGSSNPHALKRSRVDQLCLECHSTLEGSTLGSQPVSTHDLRSPRYRECTVCHVAVHGSNASPTLLR
jgi:DmsE family decaheme c-type cytochrome